MTDRLSPEGEALLDMIIAYADSAIHLGVAMGRGGYEDDFADDVNRNIRAIKTILIQHFPVETPKP